MTEFNYTPNLGSLIPGPQGPRIIRTKEEIQTKSEEERTLYYLGGEPDENNSRLTIGKNILLELLHTLRLLMLQELVYGYALMMKIKVNCVG